MTSKEKVLSVHPDAYAHHWGGWRDGEEGWVIVRDCAEHSERLSAGESEAEAWDDAASKLPSAPSPAGEMASEPVSTEGAAHEALRKLANEVRGWLDLERVRLAGILGNTNVAVMRDRLALAESALGKPSAEGDGWIAEPTEQGWWWHIDAGEHTDMIPFMYGIMLSGTNGKMFVQYPDSRWCSDIGGLWAKAIPPVLPAPPSGQGGSHE